MPTTKVDIYDPISCVMLTDDGVGFNLFSVNVITGVVTSTFMSQAARDFLTERMQKILPVLPGLSSAALQELVQNMVSLRQFEGSFTISVGVVGNVYTLAVAGLATPSTLQVTIPMSTSSPFTGNSNSAGGAIPPSAPALIGFGTINGSGAGATAYFHPWNGVGTDASERFLPVPYAGTISQLRVRNNVAVPRTVGSQTITIRKNGVNTTLQTAFNVDQQMVASDLVNSFTVVAGDVVSAQLVVSGDFNGNNLTLCYMTMQFVSTP